MKGTKILLRMYDVKAALGVCKVTCYKWIKIGVLTKPIRLGGRMVAWPKQEVDAIIAARVRGCNDDVIRAMVNQLHAARQADAGGDYANV